MGSDGIYDKLTNEQISECFWKLHSPTKSNYEYIGEASSKIIMESMSHMSMDNLTSLIIVFEDNGRLNDPPKITTAPEHISFSNYSSNKENSGKEDPNIPKEKESRPKNMEKVSVSKKSVHE
jgi:serine/threonine protein phosphatase PrpC